MSKKTDKLKASEPTTKKDVVTDSKITKSEGNKQMLGAIVTGMKEAILKTNGGVRKLSPEARKSRALKALVGAMITRKWTEGKSGVYSLNSVEVNTITDDFTVKVNDGTAAYSLQLGKGAIRELDSYMKLR